MTDALTRALLVAGVVITTAAFSCDTQSGGMELQVALRSNAAPTAGIDLLAGDTLAVVRLDPAEPVTLASQPAGHLTGPFRAALSGSTRPATSPIVTLVLPPAPAARGALFDVVYFADRNGDAAWQAGEPYATAWTGGRGGYRVISEVPPGTDRPAWRLVEGGDPPPAHASTTGVVVYVDPVLPAVER